MRYDGDEIINAGCAPPRGAIHVAPTFYPWYFLKPHNVAATPIRRPEYFLHLYHGGRDNEVSLFKVDFGTASEGR
jgi:hypothetical protein